VNAGVISAKATSGTGRADTLVGTNRADVIYGRGGNDKISGRGGNDRIYGGPGADTISCGTDTDTVYADSTDKVAKDCEHVILPPAPVVSPAPNVVPGHYCGFGNQGKGVCFDVTSDRRSVANVQVDGLFDNCTPPSAEQLFVTMKGTLLIPIAAGGSFDYVQPSGELAGSLFRGVIAADGSASGTCRIVESFVYQDTQYSCDTNVFGWTAKLGA
jgi:hypothetical protein